MKRPMIPLIALAVLLGAGVFGGIYATTAERPDNVKVLVDACASLAADQKTNCYSGKLEDIIKTKGTGRALDVLKEANQFDPWISGDGHPVVHHIGWSTLAHYKDVGVAFSHCKDTFWSGCYHGVLQSYLAGLPEIKPDILRGLCGKKINTSVSTFIHYQCLHGLGHGLALQFNLDVPAALKMCDSLESSWDRESCYGGVFMENVVTHTHPHGSHHQAHSAEGHDHHAKQIKKYIDPKDPLYPCNAIDKKYRQQCYLMQTSAMLSFNGYDFGKTFKSCAKVEPEFRDTCYRSLGRDISSYNPRTPEKAVDACKTGGRDEAVGPCLIGLVNDFMYNNSDARAGTAVCRLVDGKFKHDCYAAVGEFVLVRYPEGQRAEICDEAEKNFASVCRQLARIASAPH